MKNSKSLSNKKHKTLPLNQILLCDNLELLATLPEKSIDFGYIDGPYYTQKDWGDFNDKWASLQNYLNYMKARFKLLKKKLKDDATICNHADFHAVHYLKVEMDKIFGYNNLINELIWDRNNKGRHMSRIRFPRIHETILVYSREKKYTFNMQYEPLSPKKIKEFRHDDNDGKGPYKWIYAADYGRLKDLKVGLKNGKYKWPKSSKCPYYKKHLNDHNGTPPGSVIKGISTTVNTNRHGCAYEKPEILSELLIKSFTNPGDIVLDLFSGTGTACVAAKRLGRNFIGSDIDPEMIKIANRRLKEV